MSASSTNHRHHDHSVSVHVSEHWIDSFCEHVGSLSAVLKALAKIEGTDRPPALVLEALKDCSSLQDLLNSIPVFGGYLPGNHVREAITAGRIANPAPTPTTWAEESDESRSTEELGDSYPEIAHEVSDSLPTVDKNQLEERCQNDRNVALNLLQKFRFRAEGDLRELELLSVGHDWLRLARLAGVLKDAASNVSAYRIVVDAAALQGAARIGCRNDVDLALDALRADLRDCSAQLAEWQVESSVE